MANINLITAPPTRAASGLPVEITLASDVLGAPEYASLIIDFGGVGFLNTESLTIGDLVFTARNPATGDASGLAFNEFLDTLTYGTDSPVTLYQALLDTPLVDNYTITFDTTGNYAVTLLAKYPGPAYNLTAALVTIGPATLTNVAANAHLRSQTKENWGAYIELYAYEQATDRDYPADPATESRATRMTRLELPPSEANAYTFDLSAWLHTVTESVGRCVAWYVRYGEIYSTTANPYRRRYEVARWPDSGVAWGFNAAESVALYTDPREPQFLTSYFGERPLFLSKTGAPAFLISAVCDTAAGLTISYAYQKADGTDDLRTPNLHWSVTSGGVYHTYPNLMGGWEPDNQGLAIRRLDDVDSVSGGLLVYNKPATALTHWLRFVNRLGGYETWGFTAEQPAQSRTATFYQRADATTQTNRVNLDQSTRLYSALLTREQFDFLRTELAASAEVDMFLDRTYYIEFQAVNITDFDVKADPLTGEYTVSLEITPRAPFNPLTR